MDEVLKRKAAPPYVAYKTLSNFLDRFKQGVPGRIDRGLMASMSGAAQSQVTTALRFLTMISENGVPTKVMRDYVTGEGEARKQILSTILQGSYPFLFDGEFNLATATASQLREAFEAGTSATGETLGRCMNFFKEAATDAGLQVSPYITQKKPRSPAGVRRKPQPRREEKPIERSARFPQISQIPPVSQTPAQASMLLSGLFQRLPKPGTVWPPEERGRWVQTLQNVLLLEYPEA